MPRVTLQVSRLPLEIGASERVALHRLRERATRHVVDMRQLVASLATPAGKLAHMEQMNEQTVDIPVGYLVTYSVEIGHPGGTARHMTMSSSEQDKVPTPIALWMVAEELGFAGGLEACVLWPEHLLRGDHVTRTMNVLQLVSLASAVHGHA
jgi:hypothetical protein